MWWRYMSPPVAISSNIATGGDIGVLLGCKRASAIFDPLDFYFFTNPFDEKRDSRFSLFASALPRHHFLFFIFFYLCARTDAG